MWFVSWSFSDSQLEKSVESFGLQNLPPRSRSGSSENSQLEKQSDSEQNEVLRVWIWEKLTFSIDLTPGVILPFFMVVPSRFRDLGFLAY